MNKRVFLILLALCCMMVLSACGCSHEEWIEADCDTAKTCAECGETEGEPLGHSWLDATCDTAKRCQVCGSVDGTPLGHQWEEATCTTAKTCTVCSLVEGEALDHSWLYATTEAPKTCERCALTEGEKIVTDPRFTTAACQHAFGEWKTTIAVDETMLGLEGFGTFDSTVTINLNHDSTMSMKVSIADVEAFEAAMIQYIVDVSYQEFAAAGFSKEQAEQSVMDNYGMTLEEFAADAAKSMDFNAIFEAFGMTGVYYIEGNTLYSGINWNNLAPDSVIIEGDTMTLPEGMLDIENVVFTRVSQ